MSGKVYWMTGLSGAGKTTLAHLTVNELTNSGVQAAVFDGDELRKSLSSDLGFSLADRSEHLLRTALHVRDFCHKGYVCFCSLITPLEVQRQLVASILPEMHLVHIACSLKECERRDVKGLYRLARAGKIKEYTGITSVYEVPESPDVVIDTERCSIHHGVGLLLDYINRT